VRRWNGRGHPFPRLDAQVPAKVERPNLRMSLARDLLFPYTQWTPDSQERFTMWIRRLWLVQATCV